MIRILYKEEFRGLPAALKKKTELDFRNGVNGSDEEKLRYRRDFDFLLEDENTVEMPGDCTKSKSGFRELYDLLENAALNNKEARMDDSPTLQGVDVYSLVLSSTVTHKQFIENCVYFVAGSNLMGAVGSNASGGQDSFQNKVTVGDEVFACLVVEDRWRLWKEIARNKVEKKILQMKKTRCRSILTPSGAHQNGVDLSEWTDDEKRLVQLQIKEDTEDDQRPTCERESGRYGANLTVYSSFGSLSGARKGWNCQEASARSNFYRKLVTYKRKQKKARYNRITEWYGVHINNGGRTTKQKKRKIDYDDMNMEEENDWECKGCDIDVEELDSEDEGADHSDN